MGYEDVRLDLDCPCCDLSIGQKLYREYDFYPIEMEIVSIDCSDKYIIRMKIKDGNDVSEWHTDKKYVFGRDAFCMFSENISRKFYRNLKCLAEEIIMNIDSKMDHLKTRKTEMEKIIRGNSEEISQKQ